MSTTPDLTRAIWVKSSHSQGNNGQCVEWAPTFASGIVPVRDSKAPHGPALVFSALSWSSFINGVQSAELPTT
ncbi:DUF397 domain-containing protein [Streptomyces orinoci]|uniref:DUF397 domain-containing protein n=1 Tax=Streptomyces orinoci TaxID=67339 RepID=A0ABV3JPU6_STRON|nr:DUF397 domain-containing protein [Streptomyces orinoci]